MPIGTYVVDFYCHAANLIVEIDGDIHNEPEQKKRDEYREEVLRNLGFNILRITNESLLTRPESTLNDVLAKVEHLIKTTNTSLP